MNKSHTMTLKSTTIPASFYQQLYNLSFEELTQIEMMITQIKLQKTMEQGFKLFLLDYKPI